MCEVENNTTQIHGLHNSCYMILNVTAILKSCIVGAVYASFQTTYTCQITMKWIVRIHALNTFLTPMVV